MTEDALLAAITDVVRDELDNDAIVLTPEMEAGEVEGWDSLAHVRIMIAVEQRFGIRFTTSEITALKDIGALVALVRSKR